MVINYKKKLYQPRGEKLYSVSIIQSTFVSVFSSGGFGF